MSCAFLWLTLQWLPIAFRIKAKLFKWQLWSRHIGSFWPSKSSNDFPTSGPLPWQVPAPALPTQRLIRILQYLSSVAHSPSHLLPSQHGPLCIIILFVTLAFCPCLPTALKCTLHKGTLVCPIHGCVPVPSPVPGIRWGLHTHVCGRNKWMSPEGFLHPLPHIKSWEPWNWATHAYRLVGKQVSKNLESKVHS